MPDIFDDIKASRTGATQAPRMPPPSAPSGGGDIFDQIKADKQSTAQAVTAGPLTVNNIPAGHIAMTDPSGSLQAVHHMQAAEKMKAGWKVGPPAEQDPSPMQQAWKVGVTDPLKMAGGFAKETGSAIGGLATAAAAPPKTPADWASFTAGPVGLLMKRTGEGYVGAVQDNAAKAEQAAREGKAGKSLARSTAAGLPLFGPMVGRALDIGEDVEQGKMSGPESAGRGLSLIGQVASGAPEKSFIPNPLTGALKVGGKVGQVAKIKALPTAALSPTEQLAKTASPGKILAVHDAAQSALPQIQKAASDMGQPIQTVEHALDATKVAKRNLATETEAKLGEGKSLADMDTLEKAEYQKQLKPLETVQKHLETLQEQKAAAAEKAAKASKNVPATRGEAAGKLVKGAGTAGVGMMLPGGPLVHGALSAAGLVGGGADIMRGVRGLIKPSGVGVADAVDASVAGAFKPLAVKAGASTGGLPPPPGPDPFTPMEGPVDGRVTPQAPAFTRPGGAGPGKVVRPDPAMPAPGEPYVSPRMAKIKAAGTQPGAAVPHGDGGAEVKATPSGFPKATTEGMNPPRSSLAKNQKQMAAFERSQAATKPAKSLDQFEEQYKGRITKEESGKTVDPARFLKLVGGSEGTSAVKIQAVERALKAGEKIEPVKLYVDQDNNIVGADGRHRAQAAVNVGKKIPIVIRHVK